jgi:NAD(P) transhydrogenase
MIAGLENVTGISYVAVSILFILSLGGLSNQKQAKAGNVLGMVGMLIALAATFMDQQNFHGAGSFWICILPGASVGFYVAYKVAMTSMPQLVACLHSFVGLAAVFVGVANYLREGPLDAFTNSHVVQDIETFLGVFIGAITFTGSIVAYGKLQGVINSAPLMIGGWFRHVINAVACSTCVVLMVVYIMMWSSFMSRLWLLLLNAGIAFFVGWHLVMAIGGADMPVVVSMLNSYSGWATAASGFLLNNDAMIVTGALVGSSGAILSYIMCEAMNRHFVAVILGGFGGEQAAPVAAAGQEGPREHYPIDTKNTVELLLNAKEIVIVPGYGLAVARGQHAVASITEILRKMGKRVRFAIHPVAGRLPGHMNVLLAEANVPYDIVLEMDEINPDMPTTDVSIVVGANDIVNPIALTDPTSPIAGMPIIETFKSKVCIVNKRSMASGYAGVDNPLFYYENTRMLFGDSKKAFEEVLAELNRRKSEIAAAESAAVAASGSAKSSATAEIRPEDLPPVQCVIGIPKEVTKEERMVAITPSTALLLRKKGFGIVVETGAGTESAAPDSEYTRVLCHIAPNAAEVYKAANVICKVQPPDRVLPEFGAEASLFRAGQTLISFFYPAKNGELLTALAHKGVTTIAMDLVPRITRAQKIDALSALSNLAGYRSVIEASHAFGRVFTGQITAAGKLPPATVFIIGAGVAGLAAIGTAKNLGAVVKAFDTRRSVKEQIESMGGEFMPVDIDEDAEDANGYAKPISKEFIEAEMRLFDRTVPACDIVITTAAIPGRRAPILIKESMVNGMRPGSVVVDLAAGTGGNCELTRPGETIRTANGVTVIGNTDFVSRMGPQASQLYSTNMYTLINDMLLDKQGKFTVNLADQVVQAMTCSKDNQVLYPPPKIAVSAAPPKKKGPAPPMVATVVVKKEEGYTYKTVAYLCCLMGFLIAMIWLVPSGFITHFMDFVLAIIVGYHVIWNVTPALHTPLMSVTNAISGIIVVGGMLCLTPFSLMFTPYAILGALATTLATINIAGGFFVTYRMLLMFHD